MKSDRSNRIVDRSFDYSVAAIELYRELQLNPVGRILGRQFLRSATSIGANVQEAQAGQSKADFVSKMTIALKEARESLYWIQLMERATVMPVPRLASIRDETDQITRILGAIVVSAKANGK
ncbi:MAG TPA: four helix bundle protein [Chloroflexota bacterium]|nr:four helix bundle protein [Chloroflexota bacterium]